MNANDFWGFENHFYGISVIGQLSRTSILFALLTLHKSRKTGIFVSCFPDNTCKPFDEVLHSVHAHGGSWRAQPAVCMGALAPGHYPKKHLGY